MSQKPILASYIAIALMFSLTILYAFWSFYPYQTLTSNTSEFVVQDKDLNWGDTLVFESDTCIHRVGVVNVNMTLKNNVLISFTDKQFYQQKVECSKYKNASVKIPNNIPDGEYYLEITSVMEVNPIRRVSTVFRTEKFNINQN